MVVCVVVYFDKTPLPCYKLYSAQLGNISVSKSFHELNRVILGQNV